MLPIRMPHPALGLVCIVEPGTRTIELVRQVQHSRELNSQRVDGLLAEIGEVTIQAGSALGRGDLVQVGELMNRNHELLARLGVSTEKLDEAVELLRDYGALGAKLTGAGGGGAVVALVDPAQRYEILERLADRFALVLPFEFGSSA
jgi:mevalonate kinase